MPTATKSVSERQVNGGPKKAGAQMPIKRTTPATAPMKKAKPVANKAASVAGENPASGVGSAYSIMASRLANRVAEMAEGITFVERSRPSEAPADPVAESKRPRKLEMRLANNGQDSTVFSAAFLDNTLQKMLSLQTRMLKSTSDLSRSEKVDETLVKEHASQSAALSRIIAEICAEKARQGA